MPATSPRAAPTSIDDGDSLIQGVPDLLFLDGTLYGWTERFDDLVRIDHLTGVMTRIPVEVGTSNTGISLGPDGQIYLLPEGLDGDLVTVDPETGAVTTVVSLTGSFGNAKGMEWIGDTLYVTDAASTGDPRVPHLSTVNLVTGEVTPVADGPTLSLAIGSMAYHR